MGWWATGGVTVREGWEKISGEVRQLMQQNPSGLTRPELGIAHTLNGFTPQ